MEHLSADDIVAYCDGRLTPESIREIESHLRQCDECSRDVVSAVKASLSLNAF